MGGKGSQTDRQRKNENEIKENVSQTNLNQLILYTYSLADKLRWKQLK